MQKRSAPIPSPSISSGVNIENLIITSLEDDKAEDIAVVDLIGKTSFADKMIIATGRSPRHVGSIADHLVDKLKSIGFPQVSVEGKELCDWVLIDAGDIIVHVFRPEIRDVYDLEKMWMIALAEPATVQ
jgi:ribosome-associated protein